MKNLKLLFHVLVYCFAAIGFVLVVGFFAVKYGFTNTSGIIDTQSVEFLKAAAQNPPWANEPEWQTFKMAVTKDTADIKRAADMTGVPARLIVAQLVSEQMRLFYSEREIFKQVFAPLKILGNQSQFSWGVAGLKQDTAKAIEAHLKDTSSPYYLGTTSENLLDFKTANPDQERFERIVDDHNRFYSYLYVGLYLREIIQQWKSAGFDISNRPEILSTLFNIGFEHSTPNAQPKIGGALIDINGTSYSFGGLATEFYYSNELLAEFPR